MKTKAGDMLLIILMIVCLAPLLSLPAGGSGITQPNNAVTLLGFTWAIPGTIGSTTPNSGAFTTVSASGVITSTLAPGTAPFTVASTTKVTNLNADTLDGINSTAFAQVLTGTSGAIGGGALLAGACASTTVAVTGATTAMAVAASPVTYPGDGNFWFGYVSAADTVTVKVCAAVAGTPTSSAYNVRVIQ